MRAEASGWARARFVRETARPSARSVQEKSNIPILLRRNNTKTSETTTLRDYQSILRLRVRLVAGLAAETRVEDLPDGLAAYALR